MTQIGEAVAVTTIPNEPEHEMKKKKVKIRFSLFYDGTLNNRRNIDEREKSEDGETTDTYKEVGDGGNNSYDNGRTNIAIMEPHIYVFERITAKGAYNHTFKIYIEGQGTFNTEDKGERRALDGEVGDSMVGYAGGSGASGVAERAKKGYKKAIAQLRNILANYPPDIYEIEKIDVDVFGFSRGAATARYSISLMLEEEDTPIADHLISRGYDSLTKEMIEVKFAGLYDTVLSVNGSQYSYWSDNTLNQQSVQLAKKTLHLAAAEEHRLDFCLHKITSAKQIGLGKEYYLPGVHADIGGSYNQASEVLLDKSTDDSVVIYRTVLDAGSEKKLNAKKAKLIADGLYTDLNITVEVNSKGVMGFFTKAKLVAYKEIKGRQYMRPSSEVNRIINIGSMASLNLDRENLIRQGWYNEYEIDIGTKKAALAMGAVVGGVVGSAFAGVGAGAGAAAGVAAVASMGALIVNRENIQSAYSNIPLRIMADYAVDQAGLNMNPKLNQRAHIILSDAALLGVYDELKKYIANVGNDSKPEDWLDESSKWHAGIDMKALRHNHLHMSAKMAFGYFPRFSGNDRRRYYYEG